MVFSSPIFLFLFLPVVLAVYALLPGLRAKNYWLLLMSLVFYAWGEVLFIFLLLASTLMNYFLGLWVDRSEDTGRRKLAVAVAVCANIGLLCFFKYADFFVATINSILRLTSAAPFPQPNIPLPIGISFFTFHALSYMIDIYRRKWKAAASPKDVALYIFFFPQLIAGPILRWNAIAPQLAERTMSRDDFAEGIRRFVGGLAKKMLIANSLALPADQIFALSANELSPVTAWFGLLCYTLQIYFDFSGYSDMAVGMGKMFGFKFLENFNFLYLAQSVREFWQRWHMSLMSWFRDYLYIPLGGSRVSNARTNLNLLIVFVLCGLWHGAGWTYIVFGFYQAFFVILERTPFGAWQGKLPRPARHFYAMFVFVMSLVIFRSRSERTWSTCALRPEPSSSMCPLRSAISPLVAGAFGSSIRVSLHCTTNVPTPHNGTEGRSPGAPPACTYNGGESDVRPIHCHQRHLHGGCYRTNPVLLDARAGFRLRHPDGAVQPGVPAPAGPGRRAGVQPRRRQRRAGAVRRLGTCAEWRGAGPGAAGGRHPAFCRA